jgi:hypothetical protein
MTVLFFKKFELPHHQLIDLQSSDPHASHSHTADGQCADGEDTHGEGSERDRSGGDDGGGEGGAGAVGTSHNSLISVMAGLVPAIHFPEAVQVSLGLWKMDGRHKGGHDEYSWNGD